VTSGVALVGGALAGSAAGAALHRWPHGRTLLRPVRSRCSACGHELRARDLVPVISWVVLRGRCAACAAPIDPRLPLLEAGSALVVAGVVVVHGVGAVAVLLAVGAVAVLLAALCDLERMRNPDRLTVPLAILAVGGAVVAPPGDARLGPAGWSVAVPVLLALVSAACVRAGSPRPIGGGDVKLLVGVLALATLVPSGAPAVLSIAVVSAGAVAVLGLATGRLRRGDRLPFAPGIAVGYLVVVLVPSVASTIVPWAIPVAAGAP